MDDGLVVEGREPEYFDSHLSGGVVFVAIGCITRDGCVARLGGYDALVFKRRFCFRVIVVESPAACGMKFVFRFDPFYRHHDDVEVALLAAIRMAAGYFSADHWVWEIELTATRYGWVISLRCQRVRSTP